MPGGERITWCYSSIVSKLKMNADTNVSLQNTQGSPKVCFSKKSFEKKRKYQSLGKESENSK